MFLKLAKLLCISFAIVFMSQTPAKAELKIDVAGVQSNPLPIAIPDFIGGTEEDTDFGAKIAAVVENDLASSGLFQPMDHTAFIQKFDSISVQPRFADWQAINAQALIQGRVVKETGDKLKVEFRVWDVFSNSQLKAQALTTKPENWRRIAHMIADSVYERITGEGGYFDTRIVYIAETGVSTKKVKRLAIMDQDGENHSYLTDGADLVLTPRFSPTMHQITYLSYYNNIPRVYLFNIETGKHESIGDFQGMTFAPRFSPDGKRLVMSLAKDGVTDIYEMTLRNHKMKRITNHPAIDTSPSYSPDGDYITFNSDRSGTQQLYVMDSDGDNVKRISFGKGRYATPVWSPRGDYIAFTKMADGTFYIGVMKPDGSGERLLAEDYLVEAPTWSPNGRVLMFFRQSQPKRGKESETKLFTIDLTGYNERLIITPTEASDPAWSPLLP
ncbi:MAG: Tol-Pal system beta propeller repeat protein TolB [Alphaproteobacteria bacterium]